MHYGYGAVECTTLLRPMLNAYDILRSTPSRYIIGVNSTHGPVIGCEALSYYTAYGFGDAPLYFKRMWNDYSASLTVDSISIVFQEKGI